MLVFTLVVADRRLRPYFQAHPMKVFTDVPSDKYCRNPKCRV